MHSDGARTEEMNRLLSGGGTLRRQSNQQQTTAQIQEDIYTSVRNHSRFTIKG